MRIGLIDPYITYGPRDVHESGLAGTETSFVLLAEALQSAACGPRIQLANSRVSNRRRSARLIVVKEDV